MSTTIFGRLPGSHYDEPWRGIPYEIRQEIFRSCTSYPSGITLIPSQEWRPNPNHEDKTWKPLQTQHHIETSILYTCKEAYVAASKTLYRNVFCLDANCEEIIHFLKLQISPERRRDMPELKITRKAVFEDTSGNSDHFEDMAKFITEQMCLDIFSMPVVSWWARQEFPYIDQLFLLMCREVFSGKWSKLNMCYEENYEDAQKLLLNHALYWDYEQLNGDTCWDDMNRVSPDTISGPLFNPSIPWKERKRLLYTPRQRAIGIYRECYPFRLDLRKPDQEEEGSIIVLSYTGIEMAIDNTRRAEELVDDTEVLDERVWQGWPFLRPDYIKDRLAGLRQRYEQQFTQQPHK